MMSESNSPLTAAVLFVQGTLAGSVATAAAVLAIAGIGFLMLSGRLDVRRSVIVVLGCFVIFGAATIAAGIESAIFGSGEPGGSPGADSPLPVPPPPALASQPVKGKSGASDPYAGAAVPRR